jgi:two-component system, NarL family, response regulator DesR
MTRLLLADDQELFRTALAALLALQPDFEVVASVGRGDEVAAIVRDHQPDIALLDIDMPGIDGLAAAALLTREFPHCRSLILTTFGRPGNLRRAMESGAWGFVVKDDPPEKLAVAIRRVMAGERVIDPALAAPTLAGGASPLTARERDVLATVRPGSTVAAIACELLLSEGTVRNYLSAAIAKTGARNRAEAAHVAEERGWLLSNSQRASRSGWNKRSTIRRDRHIPRDLRVPRGAGEERVGPVMRPGARQPGRGEHPGYRATRGAPSHEDESDTAGARLRPPRRGPNRPMGRPPGRPASRSANLPCVFRDGRPVWDHER